MNRTAGTLGIAALVGLGGLGVTNAVNDDASVGEQAAVVDFPLGATEVRSGENWIPVARRLSPSCATNAQVNTFATYLRVVNDGPTNAPLGFIVHYNTSQVPTCTPTTTSSVPGSSTSTSSSTTSSAPTTSSSTSTTTTLPPTTTSAPTTTAPSTTSPPTTTTPPPTTLPPATTTTNPQQSNAFVESFDGAPTAVSTWRPDDWAVTVHSRDFHAGTVMEHTDAHHTSMCGSPGENGENTHSVDMFDQTTYICANHMMTALRADGYGAVYFMPDAMVDMRANWSVTFDMSTLDTSSRDWPDLWITPYDSQLQMPLETDLPDLQGTPQNAIHVRLGHEHVFGAYLTLSYISNYQILFQNRVDYAGFHYCVPPSAVARTVFQLKVENGRIKLGVLGNRDANGTIIGCTARADIPGPIWWFDQPAPSLPFTSGVVQFGHHSYTPLKDCPPGECRPNSWHWDNVRIDPAVPFTLIPANETNAVGPAGATGTFTFSRPAPANANLRFVAIGGNVQVSYDGGSTWVNASIRTGAKTDISDTSNPQTWNTRRSFWVPIPAGVASVMVRAQPASQNVWNFRGVYIESR